jgi:hypothetical protein
MKIELICCNCGIIFQKEKREITRQNKLGNFNFYCNKKCSWQNSAAKRTKYASKIKECSFCGNLFKSSTNPKSKNCCSKECAAKRSSNFNKEDRLNKIAKALQKRVADGLYVRPKRSGRIFDKDLNKTIREIDQECIICRCVFNHKSLKKTCSKNCLSKLMSHNAGNNPNCGGETNYKRYKHKDIWMDSSWEVELAIWMDSENIIWERSKENHKFRWEDKQGKKHWYFPDFYLPGLNIYLDPKNIFLQEKDKEKLEAVVEMHGITLFVGGLDSIKQKILDL